jgi:hypothetical protein
LNSFGFVLNILQIFCVYILKEIKKQTNKKIIDCLSTAVQAFSKAAQAQLRERANDYKAFPWDSITRLSQRVVRRVWRSWKVADSTPAGRARNSILPSWTHWQRTRLSGPLTPSWDPPVRSARPSDRPACQMPSDPLARSVGPACGTYLSGQLV